MTVALAVGAAVVAALVWALAVPRVRIDDPEAPDLAALVTARSTALVVATTLAAGLALWRVDTFSWLLWGPYLALGAPLVAVDLRTTFLPRRLHYPALGAMALGGVALAVLRPTAALGAVVGALAAFAFFYVAWRLTANLGFGDVRLALLLGAAAGQAGVSAWATGLLAGTFLGALHGIGHALWMRRHPEGATHFAYGPALWVGPIVAAAIAG
ncbi:MAG: prepilin peptidase [Arachnia sp.]